MWRPRLSGLVVLFALGLAAAACTSAKGGTQAAASEGPPTPVAVTLSDFTINPGEIHVAAGIPVSFEVTNEGPSPHSFGVTVGSGVFETEVLNQGDAATLDVPALAEGSYDTRCTVPGHDQLGMVGTLMAMTGAASGASAAPSGSASHSEMSAQEMADAHKSGVDAFLAGEQTDTQGGQPLRPTMQNGTKVFDLTVSEISWEITKGRFVDAMAFNGQVPGPELRVRQGDRVRVVVQNQMSQPFALHFHGVTLPNAMDGVPYITQDPIMPGEYFIYRFTVVDPPGFYVYHSHFNSAEQMDRGLYGAFIVAPKGGNWTGVYGEQPDVESTMFVGDGTLGYNINGKGFPATSPIVADQGDWVLIHLANEGALLHPMHLHGFHFEVVGEDGYPVSPQNRTMLDTLVVAPGQRFDILVHADSPGAWAFHCHILPHVEGPEGMYGMVTALVVNPS